MLCARNRGVVAAAAAASRFRVPSRRIRSFADRYVCSCVRSSGRSVSSLTITSGPKSPTAARSAFRSKTSQTTGSAPSRLSASTFSGERVRPATSWPAATRRGTSRTPITPLAPATNTRIRLASTTLGAMEWQVPTLADVLEARRSIAPHLRPTPLYGYASLDELLGTEVFVKHENHQPVGAFKVRGGVNLVSRLTPDERRRGVIAASTGNHGQSIAFAARLFGVQARIVVPEQANPGKVAAMQGMGAEIVAYGSSFDDARLHSEALARAHAYRYIHSGDEPLLIAGVATEIL